MRWLGLCRRALEIASEYAGERKAFGKFLTEHEGVQWMLGEAASRVHQSRLLTMHAAWKLEQGDFARKEVSIAKNTVADTLHYVVDTAAQMLGAKGLFQGHNIGMDVSLCPTGQICRWCFGST